MMWKSVALILLVSCAAVLLHGYHPNAEDAAIYLPGAEKALHPELFPYNDKFFASHAHLTAFPQIIAWSVKLSHLPFYSALFLWHIASIFLLLFACYRLAARCTESCAGRWAAVGLVAGLLTLPIAGTALYIMDQYVNPRNLSAFVGILAIALVLEGKAALAGFFLLLGAVIHPFMSFFGIAYCGLLVLMRWNDVPPLKFASLVPLGFLYPAPTPAYHQVALSHPYHYLLHWQWYEWLGAFGPIVIFWWFSRLARSKGRTDVDLMCRAAIMFGSLSIVAALVLAVPQRFEVLARIQPLRSFYLLYVLQLVFAGVLVGEHVLKRHVWRWLALFTPLCAGMFIVQRELFPESAHIEWPGAAPRNLWVQAFEWTQKNTPVTAIFALDPYHMKISGEDANGFRAVAERSMLADAVKDSGAVSMFPPLADEWWSQVEAQKNWKDFRAEDFRRLQAKYGVSWVVLQRPQRSGLDCPYENRDVVVCRLSSNNLVSRQLSR